MMTQRIEGKAIDLNGCFGNREDSPKIDCFILVIKTTKKRIIETSGHLMDRIYF